MSALQKSWNVLKLQGESVGQSKSNIYSNNTGSDVDQNTAGTPGAVDAAADAEKWRKKEKEMQELLDDEDLMRIIGGLKPHAEDWQTRVKAAKAKLPVEDVRQPKHKKQFKLLDSADDGAKTILQFLQNAGPDALGPSHTLGDDYADIPPEDDGYGIGE